MPINYRHFFSVKNGEVIFEHPEMHKTQLQILEGKKGYLLYVQESEYTKTSSSQWAFLYGGIIRGECMRSNVFSHFHDVDDIAQYFAAVLRPNKRIIVKPDGSEIVMDIFDDISKYNRKQLASFIQDVISYLDTEYNIFVKDPKVYQTSCKISHRRETKRK